jgi:SAM-dependent methyltransferase
MSNVMQHSEISDVPSPIDLRKMSDASAWEETAMSKRPWREQFFSRFVSEISAGGSSRSVLELGSGPGFLANRVIAAVADIEYTLLDFSSAMHQLARRRLGELSRRAHFVTADLKSGDWSDHIGRFDYVVTMQAVHELRHKAYAPALHGQVRSILAPQGRYLVCDHYCGDGGMSDGELYMTVEEQRAALESAGFRNVTELLRKGGLVLHHAA